MQVAPAVFVLLLLAVAPLRAQATTMATLACGRSTVRGTLHGNLGGEARSERVGRDGVLEVRAVSAAGGVTLEAWYDSLSLYREGPEGRFEPEAAGMIGGRYRGRLDARGGYLADASPFVPDGVREVFDLSILMQDFLPPLPPGSLQPGRDWTRGPGETIWRLADSTTGGDRSSVATFRIERTDTSSGRSCHGGPLARGRGGAGDGSADGAA
jgi:hypothetical protein